MKSRRVYSRTHIQKIAEMLAETKAQPMPERSLTASAAIAVMIVEINELQAQGYTIAEIAELLRQNDLPVTAATLKSAIARAHASRQSRQRTKAAGSMSGSSQKISDQVAGPAVKKTKASGSFEPIADIDEI